MLESDDAIERCARALRQLNRVIITFEEFADKVTTLVVASSDKGMDGCVALIPSDLLPGFLTYLEQFLIPVDYMQSPRQFLTDFSDESVERASRELRPGYQRLHQMVRDRVHAIRSIG
jgi:hypothetical protein